MVSLKRYLNDRTSTDRTSEQAPRQAVTLLIEKLSECAVDNDPRELGEFRQEMRGILEALTPDLPNESFLVLVGAAAQSLETYNKRIARTIGKQGSDFQTIVKMLQGSLITIASENTEAVEGLHRIGEELEHSHGFRDLESLKMHLSQCLSGLREEVERRKTASKALIEKLQIRIESLPTPSVRLPENNLDPTTGALLQEDCVAAIGEAINKGTRHYALVMVVNRVQTINARYGREAGDWMLLRFKEHIEAQLLPSDRLFRWTGPAMVALLERPEGLHYVRGQVKRILDNRLEVTYLGGGREVLIPVSAAWSISTPTTTPEAAKKDIETFVVSQGCRDLT